MDSKGWILAQATEASHLGSARLVGSDCLTTESTGAASVAGNHRDKAAIAGGFRQRHAVVLSLSSGGNRKLKDAGCPFVIVLGHANYYPRFGFRPASTHGIKCEWEVPAEVFMLLVLDQQKMQGVSGLAKYRHEFSSVSSTLSISMRNGHP